MGQRFVHYPGERRGRLTFVEEVEHRRLPSGQTVRRGRFRCDCGGVVETTIRTWRDGTTRSCGCLQPEAARSAKTVHGRAARGTRDPLYLAWKGMRSRCREPYQRRVPTYAGVVCDERWSTFEGFVANQPAGRPFEPGLQLTRVGDTGDYTPENCRWATKAENVGERNIRQRLLLPDGRPAVDVAREHGISRATFGSRVYRLGWDILLAATTPPR